MRTQLLQLLLPLAVFLGGCQAVNRSIVVDLPAAAAPVPGREVEVERSFEQHPGATRRRFMAVWTRPEWDALWGREPDTDEPRKGPPLDFSRSMVLAAFSGRKSATGHSVRIERIVQVDGELVVEVAESAPARGCPAAQGASFPAHVVAVPRFEGTVRFLVRQSVRGSCLQPPALRLSCRVDSPETWRSLGPVLYAKPGQQVQCEAAVEPGTSVTWRLLAAPEGAKAGLGVAGHRAWLPIEKDGSHLLGVEARGIDGQTSLERLQLETEVPRYEVALIEEEPEGARGLELVLVGRDARETPRCSGSASAGWCTASRDGFETRLSVAADDPGSFAVRIEAAPGSMPVARLVVWFGERRLVDVAVPEDASGWGSDGWLAGDLYTREARFEVASPQPACPR